MIRLGLRLAAAGGREAMVRLVTIAAAVALGVGLLLATVAGVNAVNAQNLRYAWLNSGFDTVAQHEAPNPSADPEWWLLREDYFDRQPIARVDVAATGPHSPVPPGIPALPGPGEFYASPALSALLASTPAGELADRFPGHQIGTLGPAALPAPNMLLIVVGHSPDELSQMPGASQITSISTIAPSDCMGCQVGTRADGMDLILGVVAGALLFPVLIFIGAATRLTAARREQRFAAMRLVGATPRQVSVIAAVESTVAAVAGTVLGFGVFYLLRDPLAAIPFTGVPFFPSDLSLNAIDVLAVALGVPVGAAIAARLALRRVRLSPLGVSRRVTPRAPRWYRLIPLASGVAWLAYFAIPLRWKLDVLRTLHAPPGWFRSPLLDRPHNGLVQLAIFLPGFIVVMAGIVIAGPWFTMVGARLISRRSRRPATLIGARRLADNPQAAFRAVSGLVLGLFVTSVAIGVITTIVFNRGGHAEGPAVDNAVSATFRDGGMDGSAGTAVPDAVAASLRATPGVQNLTVVRHNPADVPVTAPQPPGFVPPLPGLVSCADLARAPGFGKCPDGATVAQVDPEFTADFAQAVGALPVAGPAAVHQVPSAAPVWPAASIDAAALDRLPILSVVVGTDGSTAAIERVRTILEAAYPRRLEPPGVQGDFESDFTKTLNGWKQLANVVILASLPIAGCSLAVSIAGGLSERKRPFSLLRLTGVPLRVLRRVVALESAVPLLIVAVVAIGVGLFAADLFLRANMDYTLRPPQLSYYLIVLVGLVASLAIIGSTLPLLQRITGPETARNE